jgi:hypothetical protein
LGVYLLEPAADEYGYVGYELSTENTWHRCVGHSGTATLSNVPDGVYTITIADGISGDWLITNGLGSSGIAELPTA